ncbi:hypothetical protein ABEW60_21960 [Paenibacillus jamilae]|uniref:hypothetical protein n=1 Tax=Paenibacillus jamilae TaxID=114136 RepID=UPI003D2A2C8F
MEETEITISIPASELDGQYNTLQSMLELKQTDLHADKTANATILIEKQRWVYKSYQFYTHQLARAQRLIKYEGARKAVDHRYIQGYSNKETLLFFVGRLEKVLKVLQTPLN